MANNNNNANQQFNVDGGNFQQNMRLGSEIGTFIHHGPHGDSIQLTANRNTARPIVIAQNSNALNDFKLNANDFTSQNVNNAAQHMRNIEEEKMLMGKPALNKDGDPIPNTGYQTYIDRKDYGYTVMRGNLGFIDNDNDFNHIKRLTKYNSKNLVEDSVKLDQEVQQFKDRENFKSDKRNEEFRQDKINNSFFDANNNFVAFNVVNKFLEGKDKDVKEKIIRLNDYFNNKVVITDQPEIFPTNRKQYNYAGERIYVNNELIHNVPVLQSAYVAPIFLRIWKKYPQHVIVRVDHINKYVVFKTNPKSDDLHYVCYTSRTNGQAPKIKCKLSQAFGRIKGLSSEYVLVDQHGNPHDEEASSRRYDGREMEKKINTENHGKVVYGIGYNLEMANPWPGVYFSAILGTDDLRRIPKYFNNNLKPDSLVHNIKFTVRTLDQYLEEDVIIKSVDVAYYLPLTDIIYHEKVRSMYHTFGVYRPNTEGKYYWGEYKTTESNIMMKMNNNAYEYNHDHVKFCGFRITCDTIDNLMIYKMMRYRIPTRNRRLYTRFDVCVDNIIKIIPDYYYAIFIFDKTTSVIRERAPDNEYDDLILRLVQHDFILTLNEKIDDLYLKDYAIVPSNERCIYEWFNDVRDWIENKLIDKKLIYPVVNKELQENIYSTFINGELVIFNEFNEEKKVVGSFKIKCDIFNEICLIYRKSNITQEQIKNCTNIILTNNTDKNWGLTIDYLKATYLAILVSKYVAMCNKIIIKNYEQNKELYENKNENVIDKCLNIVTKTINESEKSKEQVVKIMNSPTVNNVINRLENDYPDTWWFTNWIINIIIMIIIFFKKLAFWNSNRYIEIEQYKMAYITSNNHYVDWFKKFRYSYENNNKIMGDFLTLLYNKWTEDYFNKRFWIYCKRLIIMIIIVVIAILGYLFSNDLYEEIKKRGIPNIIEQPLQDEDSSSSDTSIPTSQEYNEQVDKSTTNELCLRTSDWEYYKYYIKDMIYCCQNENYDFTVEDAWHIYYNNHKYCHKWFLVELKGGIWFDFCVDTYGLKTPEMLIKLKNRRGKTKYRYTFDIMQGNKVFATYEDMNMKMMQQNVKNISIYQQKTDFKLIYEKLDNPFFFVDNENKSRIMTFLQLKHLYRRALAKYHPDKCKMSYHKCMHLYRMVGYAYEVLQNPYIRIFYMTHSRMPEDEREAIEYVKRERGSYLFNQTYPEFLYKEMTNNQSKYRTMEDYYNSNDFRVYNNTNNNEEKLNEVFDEGLDNIEMVVKIFFILITFILCVTLIYNTDDRYVIRKEESYYIILVLGVYYIITQDLESTITILTLIVLLKLIRKNRTGNMIIRCWILIIGFLNILMYITLIRYEVGIITTLSVLINVVQTVITMLNITMPGIIWFKFTSLIIDALSISTINNSNAYNYYYADEIQQLLRILRLSKIINPYFLVLFSNPVLKTIFVRCDLTSVAKNIGNFDFIFGACTANNVAEMVNEIISWINNKDKNNKGKFKIQFRNKKIAKILTQNIKMGKDRLRCDANNEREYMTKKTFELTGIFMDTNRPYKLHRCQNNEIEAIYRQLKIKLRPDPKELKEFSKFCRKEIDKIFTCNIIEETDVMDYINSMGPKRYEYKQGYEFYEEGRKLDLKFKMHPKTDEKFFIKYGEPKLKSRNISAQSAMAKSLMGFLCDTGMKILHQQEWSGPGKNPNERCEKFEQWIKEIPNCAVMSVDGSAFDSTQHREILEVTDKYFLEKIRDNCSKYLKYMNYIDLSRIISQIDFQVTTKNFYYKIHGTQMSGRMNTCLCNTLRSYLYVKYIISKMNNIHPELIKFEVCGDDQILFMPKFYIDKYIFYARKHVYTREDEEVEYGLGQIAKTFDIYKNITGAEYLSTILIYDAVNDRLAMVRKPDRFLQLTPFTFRNDRKRIHKFLYLQNLLAISDYQNTKQDKYQLTFYRVYLEKMNELAKKNLVKLRKYIKPKEIKQLRRIVFTENESHRYSSTNDTREKNIQDFDDLFEEFMFKNYGINRADIESYVETVSNIKSINDKPQLLIVDKLNNITDYHQFYKKYYNINKHIKNIAVTIQNNKIIFE
jgi:hypothetical protein